LTTCIPLGRERNPTHNYCIRKAYTVGMSACTLKEKVWDFRLNLYISKNITYA